MDEDPRLQMLEVGADVLEAIGDQLLGNGLVRDIPILGSAIQIAKSGKTITDRIFLAKVQRFIQALSSISEGEREQLLERMDSNPESQRKAGETIALVLDRLDDLDKPAILAHLFEAYVRGSIDLVDFRRLASAVDLANTIDLQELVSTAQSRTYPSEDCMSSLLRTGLTEVVRSGFLFDPSLVHIPMRVTRLGNLYVDVLSPLPPKTL